MKARLLVAALALLPWAASAHRMWLLPSSTMASGRTPVITVDGAVSENLFDFDGNALKLDGLEVTAPDGSKVAVDNASSGRHRSSFDFSPRLPGTYRISNVEDSVFASYTQGGETKRWRGSPEALANEVPAGVDNLNVTRLHNRVETFVSHEEAGGKALAPAGIGLELQPLSAPTDLLAGDTSEFRLLLDGKPAAGVLVTVVRGGNRYRYKLGELTLQTDADGRFRVTWPEAGAYWLNAAIAPQRGSVGSAAQPLQRHGYSATFEVLPR